MNLDELSKSAKSSSEMARIFVKELGTINDKMSDARDSLKQEIEGCDEMTRINDELKALRDERKQLLITHPVLCEYNNILEEVKEEKRQLVSDAKSNGVPKKEIDTAISMLKKDIDPGVTTEMFKSIADLIS